VKEIAQLKAEMLDLISEIKADSENVRARIARTRARMAQLEGDSPHVRVPVYDVRSGAPAPTATHSSVAVE